MPTRDPVYVYEEPVLAALALHGLRPLPHTPPALLRGAVLDLYRYELVRLRGRLLAGEFLKSEYAPRVIELRKHYWLLSVPVDRWVVRDEPPA